MRAIAVANFSYGWLTAGLVFYHFERLTVLCLIYFALEVTIVLGLSWIEWSKGSHSSDWFSPALRIRLEKWHQKRVLTPGHQGKRLLERSSIKHRPFFSFSMETEFKTFAWRMVAVHTITYFLVGIAAMNIFDYTHHFSTGALGQFMKPTDSPWVAAGPGLQVIRGLIFAGVLWPFREKILLTRRGWLPLWGLFTGLSILSTFGPAPGSVDGLIYTTIPVRLQILFLPELILQSLLLSLGVFYWYASPKKGFNILSVVLLVLVLLMSLAGFLSLAQ